MQFFIMAGILPAIFLVEIGQYFRPSPDQPLQSANWTGYLLSALLLLLAVISVSYRLMGDIGSLLLMIMFPSAMGILAQTILWLVESRFRDIFHSGRLLVLLLANLLLLAGLYWLTDGFIGAVVVAGGLLLALAWTIWERAGKAWGIVYLLVILLGLVAGWRMDLNQDIFEAISWLGRASSGLAYLFIILFEILVLFRLLHWALQTSTVPNWPRAALAGLTALPILGLAGWQIATAAAWDVATDGLGGIATLQLAGTAGIAAAILTAWQLPVNRRPPVFILGLVLPLYMLAWMNFGTFGLDGPWGRVPIARTERRAGSIERALQRYNGEHGSYPAALDELTPNYLLILPGPFIIPGQDWCYEGGPGYYRLGYVYREYFSTPASVRIAASEGQPPNPDWPCEAEAARYPGPPELEANP